MCRRFRVFDITQNFTNKITVIHFVFITNFFSEKNAFILDFLNKDKSYLIFSYLLIIDFKFCLNESWILWFCSYNKFKISVLNNLIFFFSDRFFHLCKYFLMKDMKKYLIRDQFYYWILFSKQKRFLLESYDLKVFFNNKELLIFGFSKRQVILLSKVLKILFDLNSLRIFDDKFFIGKISDSFTIGDWWFQKQRNGLFCCKVSKNSLANYRREIKFLIQNSNKLDDLLLLLNSKIRSWITYNKNCTQVIYTYSALDHYMFRCLMKRLKKFHTNKSKLWVFKKYWKFVNNKWTLVVLNKKKFILLISHLDYFKKYR